MFPLRSIVTLLLTLCLAGPVLATKQPHGQASAPGDEHWDNRFNTDGMSNNVLAIAVATNGMVYAGGSFTLAGPVNTGRIARWDGSNWNAMGVGMSDWVHAIAVAPNGDVYAGGSFTQAGGNTAFRIARWNGSSWSALGTGTTGLVRAVAVDPNTGDVYIGGDFTAAGSQSALRVAMWDGNSWSALGAGVNGTSGPVHALAHDGTNLYVGGDFTTAGGSSAFRIAQWNGNSWSAMSTGMNQPVFALTTANGRVYAGGTFTAAGGGSALRIARWNGSSWSNLRGGLNTDVFALAASGNNIYVTGAFTTADGGLVNRIAHWNGSNWLDLGSGLNTTGWAIGANGDDVYVGGEFTVAGLNQSLYFGRWNEVVVPVFIQAFDAEARANEVVLTWDVFADEPFDGFRIYRADGGGAPRMMENAGLLAPEQTSFTDRSVHPNATYHYILAAIKPDGSEVQSQSIEATTPALSTKLYAAYPNPFNPSTTIRFVLAKDGPTTLTVHDVKGRHVITLVNETLAAGAHNAMWNGRNTSGTAVASGVYFYRLESNRETITRKMVLAK
jgi:hypothetical protein